MILRLILLFLAWLFGLAAGAAPDIWTVVAVDARGDARDPSLADVAQLSYRYDKQEDMLWFRLTLYGKANEKAFGLNIAVDTGADVSGKMNWWGGNSGFKFDRLLSAWVTRVDGAYQGRIGVGGAGGARAKTPTNMRQDNLQIRVEGDSILVGIKRTDLTDRMQMNVVAAVGDDQAWNDDIPNARSAAVDLAASRPLRGLREIDVSRNNLRFAADYKTLPTGKPAHVVKAGRGRERLILIPGMYSGGHVFDGFIKRNASRYELYVLTPPGLYGTAARPLPPESTSYGEYTWTRLLEDDILELIDRERLDKPFVVAHGFPGSLAAEKLASQLPQLFAGLVEIASTPVSPAPSLRDPSRQATPEERIAAVNDGWAQKWFKYVTPQTWESNNYRAVMLANDQALAERARRQFEAVPLPVKIRYLAEYMAADHTAALTSLAVPLLALRPGFNESVLVEPQASAFKTMFLDSWEPFARNPRIQLMTIGNARALVLDDQPTAADAAIAAFVEAHSPRRSRSQ
jgi:pimeloyl-ACP methyl ester carboxylesterase